MLQFKIQKVWILVDLPYGKKAIGTKWVYRNKKDERGVVVRNKARLVTQGHKQEEGIDYDESFVLSGLRIEAIRIFLAFASYMGFIVYQMDVKSAFLYGKIDEEVYVSQPPGFLDPKYPQKNGYRRGTIDKTLFLKKDKHDIILVQVYVDDIIFGSTKKSWCDEFEALMKSRFQMSSMGELTLISCLQVKQKANGIFISQDKYVAEILKKFDFVNVRLQSMIGSLMYLTASRPDIMFAVCACSRCLIDLEATQIVTMMEHIMTGFQRRSCCGKFCGFKINYFIPQTKHIAIRHHFIRDAYEKKLIQVLKIHTDDNVADLLTKAFDVSRSSLGLRESLGRALDGTEALLLPKLFILWLATVSTDSAELVPMGNVSTAIESLKKNTAKEKNDGNAEFHEIIDFLTRSSIHHALTAHYCQSESIPSACSTTSAKSKIINNVLLHHALGFHPNGDKQLENVPVPLNHFPVNALTSKVFSFMVKKGKHFSGKVIPLFASMLVQPTKDEGALYLTIPRPSPSTLSDSIPESLSGIMRGFNKFQGNSTLEGKIRMLMKQDKLLSTNHKEWIKSKRPQSVSTLKIELKANGFLGWHQNWILVNLDSDILADPYLEWNQDAYLDDDLIPPSNPDGTLKQLFDRVKNLHVFQRRFIDGALFQAPLRMGAYLRRKDDDGIRLKSALVNNVEELVEALSEEVVLLLQCWLQERRMLFPLLLLRLRREMLLMVWKGPGLGQDILL
ncbi:putative ribonuclease H-like domain-containing protein [Tanacetum coccineum]|uniref:Ribonuclease H-like domain-containing protein n=1 Tax=Tanacetum coccineum TaxID=301880 RepID=A0ABQ4YHR8_9ASTR